MPVGISGPNNESTQCIQPLTHHNSRRMTSEQPEHPCKISTSTNSLEKKKRGRRRRKTNKWSFSCLSLSVFLSPVAVGLLEAYMCCLFSCRVHDVHKNPYFMLFKFFIYMYVQYVCLPWSTIRVRWFMHWSLLCCWSFKVGGRYTFSLRTDSTLKNCLKEKTHNVQHFFFLYICIIHLCFPMFVFLHCHVLHLFLAVSKLSQAQTTDFFFSLITSNPQCQSKV